MKELDEFARLANSQGATIKVRSSRSPNEDFLQPDALLQTPLIALCLLMTAHRSAKGIEASHSASLTSAIFATYFVGLGNARGRLAWSPAMRIKCAEALAELEVLKLIVVDGTPRRYTLTQRGKDAVTTALNEPRTEIGKLARGLRRAHDDVEAMGLQLL